MKNPFPGMNPWLEEYWRDVHASVLVYARDLLNGELPPGLHVRVDERLAVDAEEENHTPMFQTWPSPSAEIGRPDSVLGKGGLSVTAAEPIVVDLSQQILRHLGIVDSHAHVITAIELLSPSNKDEGEIRDLWHRKRRDYLAGGINVVEIDLLRAAGGGCPTGRC